MATEYIALPSPLLQKVKEAAASEAISPEELVRDAVEDRINRSEWIKALAFGDRNAKIRGLKIEDVEAELSAARSGPAR
jgi:hypothetical protein